MQKLNIDTLNPFQRAYLECALWSSVDFEENGNEPLDSNYDITDIAPETLVKMLADCDAFETDNSELLEQAGDRYQNGHDFWLTRNGHGAGFWDRGYGAIGNKLSEACKAYGSCDIYPGDDGQLYI